MDPQKLQKAAVRVQRTVVVLILSALFSCSTLPKIEHKTYRFPKEAYFGDPKRPFQALGMVRTRVAYPSLDMDSEEAVLCRNYFNKAVIDLVRRAKDVGAEAVVDVNAVVFLADGRREVYPRAECSDDGQEGEVLAQGIAVNWKPESPDLGGAVSPVPAVSPLAQPKPDPRIESSEVQ